MIRRETNMLLLLINKYARPLTILLFFVLVILFEIVFTVFLGPRFLEITNETDLLDMTTFYSAEQAYEIIGQYGTEGRDYYNYIQIIDFFFPVVYALFFALLITYLLQRRNWLETPWRRLALIPLVAGFCDWLENAGIFIMLRRYPVSFDIAAQMTNIFCVLKFALIGLSMLVVLVLLGMSFIQSSEE